MYDMEYCLVKYNKTWYDKVDITDPNFVYMTYQPDNVRMLFRDIIAGGSHFNSWDEILKVRHDSFCIILENLNNIYQIRKNRSELVLFYWIRSVNITCLGILDENILCSIIVRYLGIIRYNKETLDTTMKRYVGVWSPYKSKNLEYVLN